MKDWKSKILSRKICFHLRRTKSKSSPDNPYPGRSGIKTTLKILLWTLGTLLALMLLFISLFDFIALKYLTAAGHKFTGSEISIEQFAVSLFNGTVHAGGVKISNPDGFSSPAMIEIGNIFVDTDILSLFSKEININDLHIENVYIRAEALEKNDFNILSAADHIFSLQKSRHPEQQILQTAVIPEQTVKPWSLKIRKYQLDNIILEWQDTREKNNITGFGVNIREINGSLTDGTLNIKCVNINNPATFKATKMLTNADLEIKYTPGTVFTVYPEVDLIRISGFDFTSEYNSSGEYNVTVIIDSLAALFAGRGKNQTANNLKKTSGNGNKNKDQLKKSYLIMEQCQMNVLDDRTGKPAVTLPLSVEVNIAENMNLEDGTDLFTALRQQGLSLQKSSNNMLENNTLVDSVIKQGITFFFGSADKQNSGKKSRFNQVKVSGNTGKDEK